MRTAKQRLKREWVCLIREDLTNKQEDLTNKQDPSRPTGEQADRADRGEGGQWTSERLNL